MNQFARFLVVGGLNTVWGYVLIFGFMFLLGWSPELSNVAGYSIGLVTSYLLNRRFTFRSRNPMRGEMVRFALVFLFAYTANLAALLVMVRVLEWNAYMSQVLAGTIYVASAFLLSRTFVFRRQAATTTGIDVNAA
jgi:putative flippase GtrA